MTALFKTRPLVLGVHPTSRGFGYAVFENPLTLHSFAVYTAPRDKNGGCLRKLERLLKRYQPEVFVLETFDGGTSQRSARIRELCTAMVALAADNGAKLAIYRRGEVAECFAGIGAQTRDEIAAAVSRQLPALQAHLPEPRKLWTSEDKRLAVFTACALVLTHYRNGATALLDEMRDAA